MQPRPILCKNPHGKDGDADGIAYEHEYGNAFQHVVATTIAIHTVVVLLPSFCNTVSSAVGMERDTREHVADSRLQHKNNMSAQGYKLVRGGDLRPGMDRYRTGS